MVTKRSRNIMYNWSQTTSSHGIPHIGRAASCALRSFWSIIFFVAMCLLVWQVCLLVQKYLDYDKVTKMELKFQQRPFPAVTICNLNPFVKVKAMEEPDIRHLMETYNATAKALSNGEAAPKTPDNDKYSFTGINDTVALESKAKENLVFLSEAKTMEERRRIGYNKDSFIISCSFNTDDCSEKDFKDLEDPKYGVCYTFNHDPFPQHTSSRAGPLYGLRMVLNTSVADYLLTSESSGVRVVVHNQTEQPFPDTFGYNAASGYSTSLGISYREIDRLGYPYGDCKMEDEQSRLGAIYPGKYTMEGCFRTCMQWKMMDSCSCADPRYAYPNDTKSDGSLQYQTCRLTDNTQIECYKRVTNNHTTSVGNCTCSQPCQQGVYDVTVSTARWPSGVFMIPGCTDKEVSECTKEYRDNALMIEVFYEQLNYKQLKESPAYTMVNLVSDFGGQAGLWLGVSVVTGVEVIVLGLQLCCGVCVGKNELEDPPGDEEDEDAKNRPGTASVSSVYPTPADTPASSNLYAAKTGFQ